MSPDLFIVLALVVAVALGRTRLFLRDWLPFAAIFLAWESMRGLADDLGTAVHSDDIIAIERFLFFGRVPSVELQAALHVPGQINILDLATTFLYVAHFALPLVVAFVFWISERRLFYRYLMALMLMSFAAFLCYLLIPVAPPRFAGAYGESLAGPRHRSGYVRAAPLRPGHDMAVREHLRQPRRGDAFPPLRVSAARVPLRPNAMAASLAHPAGVECRDLVLSRLPGASLRHRRRRGYGVRRWCLLGATKPDPGTPRESVGGTIRTVKIRLFRRAPLTLIRSTPQGPTSVGSGRQPGPDLVATPSVPPPCSAAQTSRQGAEAIGGCTYGGHVHPRSEGSPSRFRRSDQ